MDAPTTLYLVSCVGQKRDHACAARDLYVSAWFVKARNHVEQSGRPWFILSAEHGLLAPDRTVAPYERTLNAMTVAERRVWAERVDLDLRRSLPHLSHVVFLAGDRYRQFLAGHLTMRGIATSVPMGGLRIGEQLRWLQANCSVPGLASRA